MDICGTAITKMCVVVNRIDIALTTLDSFISCSANKKIVVNIKKVARLLLLPKQRTELT